MATTITDLLCNHFGGIRRKNSRFDAEQITCTNCQNIELYDTKINQGVGIRTSKGSKKIYKGFSTGEVVYGMWESNQSHNNVSNKYFFVYTETPTQGKFYLYDPSTNTMTLKKDSIVKSNGICCGTDFVDGNGNDADNFIFANGKNIFRVHIGNPTEVVDINGEYKYDADGASQTSDNHVRGIGCVAYDSRLWLFHENKLIYSVTGDCDDFHTHDQADSTRAGTITFTKNITAITPYLGSLAIFFSDSSCLLSGHNDYEISDESPGGCASYDSLIFHGTQLWFYDDTKKGVFSFNQVVNGDKTLGDNVAIDIQEELLSIDKTKLKDIRTMSVVTADRNEIWFLLPTHVRSETLIMIFDYSHGEWVKRVCPAINCFAEINDNIYSGGLCKINQEYEGNYSRFEYDETSLSDKKDIFKQSIYECSVCNFGIDNALKIFYYPPRISMDMINFSNKFYVKYIRNYDYTKNRKEKSINGKGLKRILHYDCGECYDSKYIYPPSKYSSIAKLPSATFKTLIIQIYNKESDGEEADFAIQNLECTKVKIKQI